MATGHYGLGGCLGLASFVTEWCLVLDPSLEWVDASLYCLGPAQGLHHPVTGAGKLLAEVLPPSHQLE